MVIQENGGGIMESVCFKCGRRSKGRRPNPGEDNPNYLWWFDDEDRRKKNDPMRPYGYYHTKCHKDARKELLRKVTKNSSKRTVVE